MLILSTWDAWKKFKIEPIYFPAPMNVNLINPVFPHLWSAGREYIYSWKWDLGECAIRIPVNYECDGASIPFRFYDVVDPVNALIAAFLHDILYETQCGFRTFNVINPNGNVSKLYLIDAKTGLPAKFDSDPSKPDGAERRSRADALFRAFCVVTKMPQDQVDKCYVAVREFGKDAWDSEEPEPSNVHIESLLSSIMV